MVFFEKYILFRSLNYLRVSHNDSSKYNFSIPAVFTVIIVLVFQFLVKENNIYGKDGFLDEISSVLMILSPFYIAALAAVATFNGQDALDKPVSGIEPTVLSVLVRGNMAEIEITLRHFLSLMFGYCSFMSLSLFFSNLFVRYIALNSFFKTSFYVEILGWIYLLIFIFFLMQLMITTLLGLYFLCDKLHRPG